MNESIREYSVEHYEKTVEWLNNPYLQDLFGLTYNINLEGHSKWILKNRETIETLALYSGEQYVGNIVLSYNLRHSSCYLQIYIGEEKFRGQGRGERFMSLALNHIFDHRTIHRLWLNVASDNIVAKKLYVRLGFQDEGVERDSVFNKGKYISQLRMSLLSSDYRKE